MRLAHIFVLAMLSIAGVAYTAAPAAAAEKARPPAKPRPQSGITINAFYGAYQGAGIAENADSLYFGATMRDFDAAIHPAGNGFTVSWTTIVRDTGTPSNPKVRRKSTALTFVPTGTPNLWRAEPASDPLSGTPYAWARLSGTSLIVYVMAIGPDGRYEIQRYDRRLIAGGLDLVFTVVTDGDKLRTVKGRLTKTSN